MARQAKRPAGWSPEWFLAWRASNLQVPLEEQFERWAAECGSTRSALKNQVQDWKRVEPGFADRLATIDPNSRRPARGQRLEDRAEQSGWRARFLAALRTTLNRQKAAEMAGLSWDTIRRKLRPGHADEDPALIEMVRLEEERFADMAREGLEIALVDSIKERDRKILSRLAVDVLERMDPSQFGRHQTVNVTGGVDVKVTVTLEKALAEAARLNQSLSFGRDLPPAPATVDLVRDASGDRYATAEASGVDVRREPPAGATPAPNDASPALERRHVAASSSHPSGAAAGDASRGPGWGEVR